jgi:hypothetical protein
MTVTHAAPPIEALVVDRKLMVRALRLTLEELHARRQSTPNLTGSTDINAEINYWEHVFTWLTRLDTSELVVMERR